MRYARTLEQQHFRIIEVDVTATSRWLHLDTCLSFGLLSEMCNDLSTIYISIRLNTIVIWRTITYHNCASRHSNYNVCHKRYEVFIFWFFDWLIWIFLPLLLQTQWCIHYHSLGCDYRTLHTNTLRTFGYEPDNP